MLASVLIGGEGKADKCSSCPSAFELQADWKRRQPPGLDKAGRLCSGQG